MSPFLYTQIKLNDSNDKEFSKQSQQVFYYLYPIIRFISKY